MSMLFESYTTGKDADYSAYGNNWCAQTFSSSTGHYIDYVVLYGTLDSPALGNVTVSIRETSAGLPTGSDLCSGTIDGDNVPDTPTYWFIEFNLTPKVYLKASTTYAIVIRSDGSGAADTIKIGYDDSAAAYASGQYCSSADAGASWAADSGNDFIFYEYGYQLGRKLYNNIKQRLEGL